MLTPEASVVVPWVDAMLVAGILVYLVDLVFDRPWLRAVGDMITTVIGLIAAIAMWTVFPFDFRAAPSALCFPQLVWVFSPYRARLSGGSMGMTIRS